jgi:hypothetical protein
MIPLFMCTLGPSGIFLYPFSKVSHKKDEEGRNYTSH